MNNYIGISEARQNLPKIIDDVSEKQERVVITVNGKPKAVVLSPEELESIEETAEIMATPGAIESIRQGIEDIKNGRVVPLEEVLKRYERSSKRKSR